MFRNGGRILNLSFPCDPVRDLHRDANPSDDINVIEHHTMYDCPETAKVYPFV